MNDVFFKWVFFLLNPFASMILTFFDYKSPYGKNIFWAFCTFYGLSFAIGSESTGSDIIRYLSELEFFHRQDNYGIADAVQYFAQSGEIDILRTFLSYFISRFTDSQAVLTMVYGFIFGFFFSRNIWYIFKILKNKLTLTEKFLLLALALVVPIWFLGGFRMYTAFHIFIYGLLSFIFENKKSKLIFVLLSFLVHFSFLIPISIVGIYIIFGNQLKIYFIIFSISIFVTNFNVNAINRFVETYLPAAIDERSESYRTEDKVALARENIRNDQRVWYVAYYKKIVNWAFYIIIFYFFIFATPRMKLIPYWRRLFSFTLLFCAFSNILINLPSGVRFLTFSFFLTFTMVILYLNEFRRDIRFINLIKLLSPAFLLFVIVSIRMGLYNTSLTTIIGNPIFGIFMASETISINDLIK